MKDEKNGLSFQRVQSSRPALSQVEGFKVHRRWNDDFGHGTLNVEP